MNNRYELDVEESRTITWILNHPVKAMLVIYATCVGAMVLVLNYYPFMSCH